MQPANVNRCLGYTNPVRKSALDHPGLWIIRIASLLSYTFCVDDEQRRKVDETIASLERQIILLEKLIGHEAEIAACKKAIEDLRKFLPPGSD